MNDLARVLLGLREPGVRLVYGVCSAAPNTVVVMGSDSAVVMPYVSPVAVDDYVAVLESGVDRLILGPVTQ